MKRLLFSMTAGLLLAGAAWTAELRFAFPSSAGTVPRPSPEYAVKMGKGQELLLSKYRGKVVAVEFLLTTCPHCQKTAQHLEKLSAELGKQGFQAVGIAINLEEKDQAQLQQFIQEYKLTFPVGVAPNRESVNEYLQLSLMSRMLMPQMVFIDRKGVIQAQYSGDSPFFGDNQEQNLRTLIQQMLKEPAVVSSTRTGAKARAK